MMQDHENRALKAYFRHYGKDAQQPTTPETVEHQGKHYVVLFNVNGPLAVYQLLDDGSLKGLKEWPSEITEGIC